MLNVKWIRVVMMLLAFCLPATGAYANNCKAANAKACEKQAHCQWHKKTKKCAAKATGKKAPGKPSGDSKKDEPASDGMDSSGEPPLAPGTENY